VWTCSTASFPPEQLVSAQLLPRMAKSNFETKFIPKISSHYSKVVTARLVSILQERICT
jgi:hypothetical protein